MSETNPTKPKEYCHIIFRGKSYRQLFVVVKSIMEGVACHELIWSSTKDGYEITEFNYLQNGDFGPQHHVGGCSGTDEEPAKVNIVLVDSVLVATDVWGKDENGSIKVIPLSNILEIDFEETEGGDSHTTTLVFRSADDKQHSRK